MCTLLEPHPDLSCSAHSSQATLTQHGTLLLSTDVHSATQPTAQGQQAYLYRPHMTILQPVIMGKPVVNAIFKRAMDVDFRIVQHVVALKAPKDADAWPGMLHTVRLRGGGVDQVRLDICH